MNKTFQSFVFGCRVNEAERIKIDRELIEAGYTVDLALPAFLIINTCAITGKAEREAKQLIHQLRRKFPQARIVITGCSATAWAKYNTTERKLADLLVPNDQKSKLISLLRTSEVCKGPLATASVAKATELQSKTKIDKFRYSNRLLVKIQDGCHRFCSYCIVPYLRGAPQSQKIKDIVTYINSFTPTPSEVTLSAINTESFGKDTGETMVDLIKAVLQKTSVSRVAFGSIHPWSLTEEFIDYYRATLSKEERFVHFFHVPIQSGSQTILEYMKREYKIKDVLHNLERIKTIQPNTLIATDVIVGYLGETEKLFEETHSFLEKSPITKFHVFRFSNRPHTAAFYMKQVTPSEEGVQGLDSRLRGNDTGKVMFEPASEVKKERSEKLIALSKKKYQSFIETQINRSSQALVIAKWSGGFKILLDNQVEGVVNAKHCLPGSMVHVTIISAKDGVVVCKES